MDVPEGPIAWFPANGLPHCSRHITSHSKSGSSIFTTSDHGDHHRSIARGWAHQNILYSVPSVPTDLNNEADIAFSKANEVRRISLLVSTVALFSYVGILPQLIRYRHPVSLAFPLPTASKSV